MDNSTLHRPLVASRTRSSTPTLGLFAVAMLLLSLAGCSSHPYDEASVVIDDAHGGAHTLAINEDSSQLASGSWSGRIALWGLPHGQRLLSWQAHRGAVNGLVYGSSDTLLSAGHDGSINEWTVTGKKLRSVPTGSPITAMTVDIPRQLILTGHKDGGLRLRSISDPSAARTLGHHQDRIRAVSIAPNGRLFASSATDGKVKLWQVDGSFTDLPKPGSDARTLVFSPGGQQLYGGGWFDLYRWDLKSAKLVTLDTEHRGIINSILFHPDGEYLASISRQTDSAVLFLNPDTGDTLQRFQPHKLCGGVVVISPDSRIMATTSDDASVMIWNLGETPSSRIEAATR